MKLRPKFLATAFSGMPHKDVDQACQIMLRNFPEALPAPYPSSPLPRNIEGLPGLTIDRERKVAFFDFSSGREGELTEFYQKYLSQDLDYFASSPELDPHLYRLSQMLKEKPSQELKFIHFSVRGPYTFGLTLKDKNGAPAFYDDTLRDVIIKHLGMKARWRQRKIRELFPGVQTLFHIGEAGLGVYSSAGGAGSWEVMRDAINEVLDMVEGIRGIHCCANFDWSLLMGTTADFISFDTYRYGDTISLYPEALKKFLERGGMIAWGIVPTACAEDITSETPTTLVERLERVIQSLVDRGIERELLAESSLITPSCATTTLSPELAERVFEYTREVSRRMKEKYFG